MSLCYWNLVYERRELNVLAATTCLLYACDERIIYSDSSGDDTEVDEEVSNLPLLLTIGTICKHADVYQRIEDTTIVFGRRMKIDDYNESQCLLHFSFRKDHLKDICVLLWSRIDLVGTYDNVVCRHRYKCPFETGILILLYRLSRPRRIRPEMEEFFGMRLTHLSCVLHTIVNAMYDLSRNYFENPNIFCSLQKPSSEPQRLLVYIRLVSGAIFLNNYEKKCIVYF